MKNFYVAILTAIFAMFGITPLGWAHNCEGARQLAEKASDHYKAVGKDRAFIDFGTKDDITWNNPELPLMIVSFDGIVKANASNPKLVNNPLALQGYKDLNGVFIIQEIIKSAKENSNGNWVKYLSINPSTRKQGKIFTWVKSADALIYAVSCYPDN